MLPFQTRQDIRSTAKKQKAATVRYQNGTGEGSPPPKWYGDNPTVTVHEQYSKKTFRALKSICSYMHFAVTQTVRLNRMYALCSEQNYPCK